MKPEIIFDKDHQIVDPDPESTSVYSPLLNVEPGEAVLLSMYNMMHIVHLNNDSCNPGLEMKSCVVVHKVSFSVVKDIPQIAMGCNYVPSLRDKYDKLLAGRKTYMEPVTQCNKEWVLNPCNNMALITVPGFYVFEVKDLTQRENCYIEYYKLSLADASAIPENFKLGG